MLVEVGNLANQLLKDVVEDQPIDALQLLIYVLQTLDGVLADALLRIAEAPHDWQYRTVYQTYCFIVMTFEAIYNRHEHLNAGFLVRNYGAA